MLFYLLQSFLTPDLTALKLYLVNLYELFRCQFPVVQVNRLVNSRARLTAPSLELLAAREQVNSALR